MAYPDRDQSQIVLYLGRMTESSRRLIMEKLKISPRTAVILTESVETEFKNLWAQNDVRKGYFENIRSLFSRGDVSFLCADQDLKFRLKKRKWEQIYFESLCLNINDVQKTLMIMEGLANAAIFHETNIIAGISLNDHRQAEILEQIIVNSKKIPINLISFWLNTAYNEPIRYLRVKAQDLLGEISKKQILHETDENDHLIFFNQMATKKGAKK